MKFSESLKKNDDFRRVYRKGRSVSDGSMILYTLENGLETNRLGISASKKVGNSVVRHRFARLVRESYRLNEDSFIRGIDIVVIARPAAKEADFHAVCDSLLRLAHRRKALLSKTYKFGHKE